MIRRNLLAAAASLAVAAILAWPSIGHAADDLFAPLIGKWRALPGKQVVSARSAAVKALTFAFDRTAGGFVIEWTQQRRDYDKGSGRTNFSVISRSLQFREAPGRPGLWVADGPRDPFLDTVAFARFNRGSLIVTLMGVTDEGDPELQIYTRTVKGDTMAYDYRRIVGGRQTNQLATELVKTDR